RPPHHCARPSPPRRSPDLDGVVVASALVAVNAFGDVGGAGGGTFRPLQHAFGNTTIGVVATNARLSKTGCLTVAQGGHDGLARADRKSTRLNSSHVKSSYA